MMTLSNSLSHLAIAVAIIICVATVLHAAEEIKPRVNNADTPSATEQKSPPVLPAAEVERYWIKEAKYEKLLAASMQAEKERDAQTEVLKGMCGKLSTLMLDQATDKIYCK